MFLPRSFPNLLSHCRDVLVSVRSSAGRRSTPTTVSSTVVQQPAAAPPPLHALAPPATQPQPQQPPVQSTASRSRSEQRHQQQRTNIYGRSTLRLGRIVGSRDGRIGQGVSRYTVGYGSTAREYGTEDPRLRARGFFLFFSFFLSGNEGVIRCLLCLYLPPPFASLSFSVLVLLLPLLCAIFGNFEFLDMVVLRFDSSIIV